MEVSSLNGLKFSVAKGATVFGVKGLHSKVYLFDRKAAVITSANLTYGGLVSNHECGIFVTNRELIEELHDYFNDLKKIAPNTLTIPMCESWEKKLARIVIPKGRLATLPDCGASSKHFNKSKTYYVKIFGSAGNRVELDFPITKEIDRSLCHYACGFPSKKKPRQVNEGDIIFMARMTREPFDYSIFGKARALKYRDGRDVASKQEMIQRDWKKQWPIYLRVEDPIFINGTMADGILLSDLLSHFDYDSFPSTRNRYDRGERNIKPTKSLMRKAYVKLTDNSAEWLSQKFDEAIIDIGQVSNSFLKQLPKSTTDITAWNKQNGI